MAKKKKAVRPLRQLTRRQLSLHQRQQRRQRIIFGGGVFIIAVVILIILLGWFLGEYLPRHQTVIAIGDVEFEMDYFIDALKFVGRDQPVENIQNLTNGVVQAIERNEVIRQGAVRLGISVSDDEVRRVLEGSVIPLNDAIMDAARAELLENRLNEYFSSQVPESGEQVHIMAMLVESERQALEITGMLLSGDNFTALTEEYAQNYYSKNVNQGDFGWHPEAILREQLGSSIPVDYAFGAEAGALSEPLYDEDMYKQVGYWLIKVLDRPNEANAQVQGILLGNEDEAKDVRARLEAGEDLVALVEEFSQHDDSKARGGELGLVAQGTMSEAVDSYAFDADAEVGVWSSPIRDDTLWTKGGYWLVRVLEKDDDREISDEDRSYLSNKAYGDWVNACWLEKAAVINHNFLTPEVAQWAVDKVVQELQD